MSTLRLTHPGIVVTSLASKWSDRLVMPCPSSWISWICYWTGFSLAAGPGSLRISSFGYLTLICLGVAIVAFFVASVAIQRHMRLSLLANTFGRPNELVVSGVFRFSRNPIYVAFLMPLLSLACLDLTVALWTSGVYVVAMTVFVIRREERVLAEKFGASYRAYVQSVPQWIGFSGAATAG